MTKEEIILCQKNDSVTKDLYIESIVKGKNDRNDTRTMVSN